MEELTGCETLKKWRGIVVCADREDISARVVPTGGPERYQEFCRPKNAEILQAIRLDQVYHRGSGDCLYYRSEVGVEVEVLDFLGGYGASLFGHNHPELTTLAIEFLRSGMPFNAQLSSRGPAALLSEKLSSVVGSSTGRSYVTTLANSGAEAVEAAIKHAELSRQKRIEGLHRELEKRIINLKEQVRKGELCVPESFLESAREAFPGISLCGFDEVADAIRDHNRLQFRTPSTFLSLKKGFHGKTTGAVQLTDNEQYRAPFEHLGPKVAFLEVGQSDDLARAIESARLGYFWLEVNDSKEVRIVESSYVNISALFIEPIQGEGGVRPVPADYLRLCRDMATEHGFSLVFDEIQCGMGRTGTFLCSERSGIVADYYLLGKSLGGGLAKISALLVDQGLYENEFGFIHSSTFAEDEYSALIGLRALELLEEDMLLERCRVQGMRIKKGLARLQERYPGVIDKVTGQGLMIGVHFMDQKHSCSSMFRMLSSQNLLGYALACYLFHEHRTRVAPTLSSGATLRIEPSAYVSDRDCDELLRAFERLCEVMAKQNSYHLTRFLVGCERPDLDEEIHSCVSPALAPKRRSQGARKVAFLGHLVSAKDLRHWDPSFRWFTDEQLETYLDKLYKLLDPAVCTRLTVTSETGEEVDFHFIGIFIDSRIIGMELARGDLSVVREKVQAAVDLAEQNGCTVVGFGGFTSIVTGNCQEVVSEKMALTSGNSFTVAMGIEAITRSAGETGIALEEARFAAIGATGNIASVYSELMAEEVPSIRLIGKPGREDRLTEVAANICAQAFEQIRIYDGTLPGSVAALRGVARAIYHTKAVRQAREEYPKEEAIGLRLFEALGEELKDRAPVTIATDFQGLNQANLILGASSSPWPVITPDMLGKGPIVICDVSVPVDTDPSVTQQRHDVAVIQGGIVRLPCNPDFRIGGMPLEEGHCFACMAETILLGLAGIRDHFSYGRISKDQVKAILSIGRTHGFSLARSKTERSY